MMIQGCFLDEEYITDLHNQHEARTTLSYEVRNRRRPLSCFRDKPRTRVSNQNLPTQYVNVTAVHYK